MPPREKCDPYYSRVSLTTSGGHYFQPSVVNAPVRLERDARCPRRGRLLGMRGGHVRVFFKPVRALPARCDTLVDSPFFSVALGCFRTLCALAHRGKGWDGFGT